MVLGGFRHGLLVLDPLVVPWLCLSATTNLESFQSLFCQSCPVSAGGGFDLFLPGFLLQLCPMSQAPLLSASPLWVTVAEITVFLLPRQRGSLVS